MNPVNLPIFMGLSEEEFEDMKASRLMSRKKFGRGDVILHMGETTEKLGILTAGHVHIESVDLWGNKTILSDVGPGQVFGETYALTGDMLMVDAVAASDAEVLFLNAKKLMSGSFRTRPWFPKMLRNLLMLSSRKNLVLSNRIFHTSPKRVRSRLQSYLSYCALKAGSQEFEIPFDRQQLADYLNLDRTALSKELGRMKKEGLLDFRKNHFRILED